MAYAGANQIQDTGGKVVHLASDTSSKIISKSVSKDGGIAVYRGLLHIARGAHNVKSTVRCDALLLDEQSKTSTFPYMEVMAEDATLTHEASVGKVGEDQIFYLMARGISERDTLSMIVNGFVEPFTKELPMIYRDRAQQADGARDDGRGRLNNHTRCGCSHGPANNGRVHRGQGRRTFKNPEGAGVAQVIPDRRSGEFLKLPLELSPLYTKYTGVSQFDPAQFPVAPPNEVLDLRSHFEGHLTGKETNIILQGNSNTIHVDLDESLAKSGLEVMTIHEAISRKEGLMRGLFEDKLAKSSGEKFAAFNNAFFNTGTFIHVPQGVEISSPLRKMLIVKNPGTSVIDQSMIYAEDTSRMNFLEELYTGAAEKDYLVSSLLEVRAGKSSHVDVSSLQLLDEKGTYLTNKKVDAASDSHVNITSIFLGSTISRSRMDMVMSGRGSIVEGFEVFFCNRKQRFDLESNLIHNAPDTTAALHARGC